MRELRRWIMAFLAIEAAWMIYLMMAFSATDITVGDDAGTSELGPFYQMPFVILLFFSVGLWMIAAAIRISTVLLRSFIRL
ncbi:hypothetical protein [Methylobacterium sp. C1]|uniref:hypothetical protein n=1 Tax=Methylobacterium sp. C1 TaxID=1479019 RepID=UPI0013319CFE|nr:hypothetical protein [Methylobacterium sp. C1]